MKKTIERLKQFNQDRDWNQFHTPENIAKSISIEAAELLECFQWDSHYDIKQVKDELADIFLYSLIMAYQLNLDVEEIVNAKISRNEKRYPVSKAKGSSKKYTEFNYEDNTEDL